MKGRLMLFCATFLGVLPPAGAWDFVNQLDNKVITQAQQPGAPDASKLAVSEKSAVVSDGNCDVPIETTALTENFMQLGAMGLKSWLLSTVAGQNIDVNALLKNAAKTQNWFPADIEGYLGAQVHQKRVEQNELWDMEHAKDKKLQKRYGLAQNMLTGLVSSLGHPVPYEFHLFVEKNPAPNARALPGGNVYISDSALKKNDDDLIVMLLAHELAHVFKRHTTREYQAIVVDGLTTFDQFKKLMESPEGMKSAIDLAIKTKNGFAKFSRDQEKQADTCAVRFLSQYKKSNLDRGVEGLLKLAKLAPRVDDFASTHPSFEERKANFNQKSSYFKVHPSSWPDGAFPIVSEKREKPDDVKKEGDSSGILSGIKTFFSGESADKSDDGRK